MPRQKKGTSEEQIQRERFETLRSFLRRVSVKWRGRVQAAKLSRRPYSGVNKRQKWECQCNICKQWFKDSETVMDHIVPCGTFLCPQDWVTFGENLFVEKHGYQRLCKPCHNSIKTKEDRDKGWK